jgi:hypothetical protein
MFCYNLQGETLGQKNKASVSSEIKNQILNCKQSFITRNSNILIWKTSYNRAGQSSDKKEDRMEGPNKRKMSAMKMQQKNIQARDTTDTISIIPINEGKCV